MSIVCSRPVFRALLVASTGLLVLGSVLPGCGRRAESPDAEPAMHPPKAGSSSPAESPEDAVVVGRAPTDPTDGSRVVSCGLIAGWSDLPPDVQEELAPIISDGVYTGPGLAPEIFEGSLALMASDPRLAPFRAAGPQLMLAEIAEPDRGSVLHYEFDGPTVLPDSFGFPHGFEDDGVTPVPQTLDENGYPVMHPVRDVERWQFEVARSASVHLAPEIGRVLWIDPSPEHQYCEMPAGVGK